MKILLILPHNPGDVLMGLQVAKLLHYYPAVSIDFIVGEESQELVQGFSGIQHVWVLPRKEIKKNAAENNFDNAINITTRFVDQLANQHYDLSANLFQETYGGVLQSLIHAEVKIGLEWEDGALQVKSRWMEHLFAIPVNRSQNPWHVVDIFHLAIKQALNLKIQHSLQNALHFFRPIDYFVALPQKPPFELPALYTVLHIGAAWPGKRWPLSHWAELTYLFLQDQQNLVFTGTQEELNLFDELVQLVQPMKGFSFQRIVKAIGKTSWKESAYILKNAQRVITGDTAVMHLAAAFTTPCFCLFGSSNPVETGPYGEGHFILQNNIEIPENLPWEKPSPDLAAISPQVLADLILKRRIPKNIFYWESKWNKENFTLELYDAQEKRHPFQIPNTSFQKIMQNQFVKLSHASLSSVGLANRLEQAKPQSHSERSHFDLAQALLRQLEIAIAKPLPEVLALLEDLEKKWAEATYQECIWEAYRIALNGMPMKNLLDYLKSRQQRFLQAFDEALLLF